MTHRSLSSVLLSTLAALVLAACAGGGDDPGTVYDDPVTANEQLTEDQCGKAHECRETYPFAPEMFAFFFGDNVTQCIAGFEPDPVFEQNLVEAIEAGRAIYSPDNAQACNEGVLALGCDQIWNTEVQACNQIFTGTIANGGVCQVFAECVSQFCNPQTGQCEVF
jgi:hypothetical protein